MSSPATLLTILRGQNNAIAYDPQSVKESSMAQPTVLHPGNSLPRPDPLGTSSSKYYSSSSSSSLFDGITPISSTSLSHPTPPLTPRPSQRKVTPETPAGEGSPMPLIDLAPDESVDINEIQPEIMGLVKALIDCNADLDPAMLLNRFVRERKEREAKLDAEEEAEAEALGRLVCHLKSLGDDETPAGTGVLALDSPGIEENLSADMSYLSDILSAYYMDRDEDRSLKLSTPPRAPRLTAARVDDNSTPPPSLLDVALPAFKASIATPAYQRRVAAPSPLLISTDSDENMTMPSFGMQARMLDRISFDSTSAGLSAQHDCELILTRSENSGFVNPGFKVEELTRSTATPGQARPHLASPLPTAAPPRRPLPTPPTPHLVNVPTITLTPPPLDAVPKPLRCISGRAMEDVSTFHSRIPYWSAKVVNPRGSHLSAERASHIRIHLRDDPSAPTVWNGSVPREEDPRLQRTHRLSVPITPKDATIVAKPTVQVVDTGRGVVPKVGVALAATSVVERADAVASVLEAPGLVQDPVEGTSLRLELDYAPSTPAKSMGDEVKEVEGRRDATPEFPRLEMAQAASTPPKVSLRTNLPHATSAPSKPVSLQVVVPHTTSTPVGIKTDSQNPDSVYLPFRATSSSIVISDVSLTLEKVCVKIARSPGEAFDVGDLTQKLDALLEANRLDSDDEPSVDGSPAFNTPFFETPGNHPTLLDTASSPRQSHGAKYVEEKLRQIARDRVGGAQLLFPEAHASLPSADPSLSDDPFSLPASPNVFAVAPAVAPRPSMLKPRTRVFIAPKTTTKKFKPTSPLSSSSTECSVQPAAARSMIPQWNGFQQGSLSRNNSGSSETFSTARRSPSTLPLRPAPKPAKKHTKPVCARSGAQVQAGSRHSSASDSDDCICAPRRAAVPIPVVRPLRPVKRTSALVPRQSSDASSKSTSSTQTSASSIQTASIVENVPTTDDGGDPEGMDPAAWNASLAIVPRRSNQPNLNAPSVFNIAPAVAISPVDVTAHGGGVDSGEGAGPVHSDDFSSPRLSPDTYERRPVSRGEASILSVFPLEELTFWPGSVHSNAAEEGSTPPSPIANLSVSRISIDASPVRPEDIPRSNNVPSRYSFLELEGGDEGLDTVPSSGSLGTLTPSHSVKNIAGIGKGLPSQHSHGSLARSSKESSVSSNISLSASQSFNPLPSVHQFHKRKLHTIQEESNSPFSSYFPLPSESRATVVDRLSPKAVEDVLGISFVSERAAAPSTPPPTSSSIPEHQHAGWHWVDHPTGTGIPRSKTTSPRSGTKIISTVKAIVSRFKFSPLRGKARGSKDTMPSDSPGVSLTSPTLIVHADVERTLDLSGERAAASAGGDEVRKKNRRFLRPLKHLF